MSKGGMSQNDVAKIAAEIGAQTAIKTWAEVQKRERKEFADRRFRNTELLLKNYRSFLAYVDNAVYEVEEYESPLEILQDLMMPDRDNTLYVESIKKSVARTVTIVKHIETMMRIYQVSCFNSGKAEDERRWRIINALYISGEDGRKNYEQLAEEENVTARTIYNDKKRAIAEIGSMMFGIDGVKMK